MLRSRLIPVGALAACLLPAAPARAAMFAEGVAAGDVTQTAVRLWARPSRTGRLEAVVASDADFAHVVARRKASARLSGGRAVVVTITGLRPGLPYVYRFERGDAYSRTGRFRTPPSPQVDAPVRFAVAAGLPTAPADELDVLARLVRHHYPFTVLLGGTVAAGDTRTIAEKRTAYQAAMAVTPVRTLRARGAILTTWGAAEQIPNRPAAGRRVFEEANPTLAHRATGFYRALPWGRDVELFVLDERTFRTRTEVAPECVNRQIYLPDPAPALTHDLRHAWAGYFNQLDEPVPASCGEAFRQPGRTLLGDAQLAALRTDLVRSRARFKVILSEEPITQTYFDPYEHWEAFEREREQLLAFLRDRVDNVVVLSADGSGGIVGPARIRTLEPPGVEDSGVEDIGVGPAAGRTTAGALEASLGLGDPAPLLDTYLPRAVPNGMGMRCSAGASRSFVQVSASADTLTVSVLDAAGRPVRDPAGRRCGPYRYTADQSGSFG
jgi:phosphodiesterase/alkaline phosphatase D-like protein